MSLIVLEGCDGVGKTTIARNLAAMTGASIVHCTKNTANNWSFFADIIAASNNMDIIADRFMYGQFVYQTEEERKECGWLTQQQLNDLELQLIKRGGRVFFVRAKESIVIKRLEDRDEHIIGGLSVDEVSDRFLKVFTKISLINVKSLFVNYLGEYEINDLMGV